MSPNISYGINLKFNIPFKPDDVLKDCVDAELR